MPQPSGSPSVLGPGQGGSNPSAPKDTDVAMEGAPPEPPTGRFVDWVPRWKIVGQQKEIDIATKAAEIYCKGSPEERENSKLLYFIHGRWIGYLLPQLVRVCCEKVIMVYLQNNQSAGHRRRSKKNKGR